MAPKPSLLLIVTIAFITLSCHFVRSFPLLSLGNFSRGDHQRAKPDHEHLSSLWLCPAAQSTMRFQNKPGRRLDARSSHTGHVSRFSYLQTPAEKPLSSGTPEIRNQRPSSLNNTLVNLTTSFSACVKLNFAVRNYEAQHEKNEMND